VLLFVLSIVIFKPPSRRLIHLLETDAKVWLTDEQIQRLAQPGKKTSFIDITEFPRDTTFEVSVQYPEKPIKQSIVNPMIEKAAMESKQQLINIITYLSKFKTRDCRSDEGVMAAEYIYERFKEIIQSLPAERQKLFSVQYFQHRSWKQPSVIAVMKGTSAEKVIIGGHEDSTASGGIAPGADDNASGVATVLEAMRIIAQSDYVPTKTIEFHSYAAEEIGLRGSSEVVQQFKERGEKVYAMMNVDMTGYTPKNTMAIVKSNTNTALNTFLKKIVTEYCKIGYKETSFLWGSSDHATFTRFGYPACWPFEVDTNPNIHTARDTIDKLHMDNAVEYVKAGVAFLVELS
jgi:leucyl aminopeptidase